MAAAGRSVYTPSQSRAKLREAEINLMLIRCTQEGHRVIIRALKKILRAHYLSTIVKSAVESEIAERKKLLLGLEFEYAKFYHAQKFHGKRLTQNDVHWYHSPDPRVLPGSGDRDPGRDEEASPRSAREAACHERLELEPV